MKVAIFGSAFNPPTLGHLDAIEYTLEQDIEQVWLVPSYHHAFGKQMLDYDVRLSLLRYFVADIAQPHVEIKAVESEIARPGTPVYTWDVLNHIQTQNPEYQFSFVIGPDNQSNWKKFYKADEIEQKWRLLPVPERRSIRSTLVRKACAEGLNIEQLVTPSVAEFIKTQQIYA